MDTVLNLIPVIGGVIAFCALWWKLTALNSGPSDLTVMRTELKTEITSVRTGTADVRTELRTDIARLRTEFRADIARIRAQIR